ncbi:MAG: heparinase II/III family protein, partial [Acidobacteria bacterium]|nr:heparinase II/III family protein [Acidobacteriota bacterium]
WALYFFKDSPHLTPPLFIRVMKFLHLHARHLETYLSTYFSPNTHLTGEALGLFYLGVVWPEFRRAARWRAKGASIMLAELDRHVRPDGVYFEQSTYYHRYTVEFYTHFLILARSGGHPLDDKVEKKLAAMLDHLMYITKPDGRAPLFGDDDGGRLMALDEREADDFRAALATGACLFARPDYKYVAGEASEETLWLLGKAGLDAFDSLGARPPAACSRAFSDGGYYVMRNRWGPDANYLLIDCGPHGALNCGHSHADALSFELAARGRTLLVDPGTYTYTASAEERDHFRTSAAHNTLTIDGASSSVTDGPFSWKHVARSRAEAWTDRERFDYFKGSHDGYARLDAGAVHERSVLFLKGDYWIMRDRVVGTSEAHRYDLHFHFAPDARPVIETAGETASVRERPADAPGLEIFAFGGRGRWHEASDWVSRQYGARTPAPVLTFTAQATTDGTGVECFTFMIPRAASETAFAQVREVEATGGRLFEIDASDVARDVLLMCDDDLVGDERLVESKRLASDFRWAWARFSRDNGALEELV